MGSVAVLQILPSMMTLIISLTDMKKVFHPFLPVLILPFVFSCQSTEQPVPDRTDLVPVCVNASILDTRTSIDGVSSEWTEGDQIAFITEDLDLCPPFTADESGSTTTFSGEKPSGSHLRYALYPYDSKASYSKSGIMATLPSQQDGSFASAIMVSEGNEADGFTFESACCILKLNVPSSLNIVKVEVFSEDQLTGRFGVDFANGGLKFTSFDPSAISEQKAVVTKGGSVISGTVYIAILPTGAKELSLAFTDRSGKVATVSKALPSRKPLSYGTIKELGTVKNLTFEEAAPISDPTYSQL